jgi:hypothetical protein
MKRQGSWLLLAASAAVLGACSTMGPRAGPGAEPASASSSPAFDASMVWGYHAGAAPGEAHLNYGTPDTDNVGMMFQCRREAGTVSFVTDLDKGAPGPGAVRFQSGKAKGRYVARLEKSELTDGWIAIGDIPLRDPVLAAFEQTGQISQVEDRLYPQNARSAAERAAIGRFFGVCRG